MGHRIKLKGLCIKDYYSGRRRRVIKWAPFVLVFFRRFSFRSTSCMVHAYVPTITKSTYRWPVNRNKWRREIWNAHITLVLCSVLIFITTVHIVHIVHMSCMSSQESSSRNLLWFVSISVEIAVFLDWSGVAGLICY